MEITLNNNRKIGNGQPAYIIAEVGINHNGDIDIAKKLIDKAAFLEIDAIKFQKRTIDELYTRTFLDQVYNKPYAFGKTYGDHKRFLEFSDDQLIDLQEHAKSRNIDFLVSGFDYTSFNFINDILDVPIHKIPSPYINHFPLLEHVAKFGKPLIISTGMHSEGEVEQAINHVKAYNDQLIVLQCTTIYPCEDEEVNLNVIKTFQEKFSVLAGFSSHDRGIILPAAAVALGACVIEKHFTFDRTAKGPDHAASVEPRGLELIHKYIRAIERGLGSKEKKLLDIEKDQRIKYGLSIVTNQFIPQDTILSIEHLTFKIPGGGIPPKEINSILGCKVARDLENDVIIQYNDLIIE